MASARRNRAETATDRLLDALARAPTEEAIARAVSANAAAALTARATALALVDPMTLAITWQPAPLPRQRSSSAPSERARFGRGRASVPLLDGGFAIGALFIVGGAEVWTARRRALARTIAVALAAAIVRARKAAADAVDRGKDRLRIRKLEARLEEATRARLLAEESARQSRELRAYVVELGRATSAPELAILVANHATHAFDACAALVASARGHRIRVLAGSDPYPLAANVVTELGPGFHHLLADATPTWLPTRGLLGHALGRVATPLLEAGAIACLVVPISPRRGVGGLVVVGFRDDTRPGPSTFSLASALSSIWAEQLERVDLLEAETRATRELKRERVRFETIVRELPLAVIVAAAPTGELLFVNNRVDEVFGASLEDLLDPKRDDSIVARAFAGHDAEIEVGAHGRFYRFRARPVVDDDGAVTAAVVLGEDTTLRARTARAQALLSTAGGALMEKVDVTSLARRVVDLTVPEFADACAIVRRNDGIATRLAESPAGDNDGLPANEEILAFAGAARVRLHGELLVAPMHGRSATFGAIVARRAAGFDASDVETFDELARRTGLAVENAILMDAAERARGEAERASRAKDAFLAGISHELRTPMAALQLWLDVLRTAPRGDAATNAIDAIDRSARIQSQLIDDLLEYARGVSGKLRIDEEAVDAAACASAAVLAHMPEAMAKRVELHAGLVHDSATVLGDPLRLERAISNLVGNAIKFTPAGGVIGVDVFADPRAVRVVVRDSGEGFAPETAPLLFVPFGQGHAERGRSSGGLGLGLALVRQIVELHRGSVTGASEGEGRGAVFTIELPRLDAIADGLAPAEVPASAPRLDGLCVLVLEDNDHVRDAMATVLEAVGARVVAAASAEEAAACLERTTPDVVLCDLGLPGEDGFAFVRHLRGDPRTADVPAAAVTARVTAEDAAMARAAGFHLHLAKPVDARTLTAAVARLAARLH